MLLSSVRERCGPLAAMVSVMLGLTIACGGCSNGSDSSWSGVTASPFVIECGLSGRKASAHRIEIDERRWETTDEISGLSPGIEYRGSFRLTYTPRFEMKGPYDGTGGQFDTGGRQIEFGGSPVSCE